MANKYTSPNHREILYTQDSGTGLATYVTSTNKKLDVNATFSASAIALQDGVNASIKATVASLTNANPLAVEIVDGSGNQITSFGGGTQYANGAVQATPTGTVALGWDGANVRALSTDNTGKLQLATVTITSNSSVNMAQVNGHTTVEGGVNGTLAIGGNQATNSVISTNANPILTAGSDYAGTPRIQSVKVDSTGKQYVSTVDTVTTVTAVTAITNALPAGSNLLGKVGIDQTTPGTTNNVSLSASTGAGTSALVKDDPSFGDGVTTGIASTHPRLYNGSTYDRWRGDTTNGAWVNVKTGSVTNTPVSPTTIFNGKTTVATAGTRTTLASSQTVRSITIKALNTNTGTIYVGNSTVAASNGLQLAAGEAVSFDLTNLNTVNIDSSVNGEGVTYFAVN